MNYQVQLNNGQTINLAGVEGFDTAAFTETLNNREVLFVNLGGAILNKNTILSITPIAETV